MFPPPGGKSMSAGNLSPVSFSVTKNWSSGTQTPPFLTFLIFKAFLENAASEQGSRMTAMDNATRNAGDLVEKLTINYNRSRQAAITKELIEIISGAESL